MSDQMTDTLTVERIHAEIGKLMAETAKLNEEGAKLRAEAGKLETDSRKAAREIFWYPVAIASALVGSVAGLTLALVKVLS